MPRLGDGDQVSAQKYPGGEDFVLRGSATIKNVAFTGNKGTSQITVKVPKGKTARIDHVYLGDGDGYGQGGDRGFSGNAPIFAHADHAGTCIINEVNVQNMSDNGVYASSCGNPPSKNGGGGKGQVIITNSFGANCDHSCFRVGSPDSRVENCVVDDSIGSGGTPRAFWSYYHRNQFIGCRANVQGSFMQVSSSAWGSDLGSTAVLENCTKSNSTGDPNVKTAGKIAGQLQSGSPNLAPPAGVPLTADEAVNGDSSADGQSVQAPQQGTGGSGGSPGVGGGGTGGTGSSSPVVSGGPTTYEASQNSVPPMPTGSDSYEVTDVDPKDHQIVENVAPGTDQLGSSRGIRRGDVVMIDYLEDDASSPFISDHLYSVEHSAPIAKQGDWRQRIDQSVLDVINKNPSTEQDEQDTPQPSE